MLYAARVCVYVFIYDVYVFCGYFTSFTAKRRSIVRRLWAKDAENGVSTCMLRCCGEGRGMKLLQGVGGVYFKEKTKDRHEGGAVFCLITLEKMRVVVFCQGEHGVSISVG